MTTPNSVGEQEREAFEAWRRQTTKMNPDDAVALEGFGDDAPYANKITRVMHIAWKAAWQARATLSTRVEGWMPIESAPHSADPILVISQSGRISIETGYYAHNMLHAAKVDGEECFYTHWHALPTPPSISHKG